MKDLEKYYLEGSINWDIAIVKKTSKFSAEIETEDKTKAIIEYSDVSWTKENL